MVEERIMAVVGFVKSILTSVCMKTNVWLLFLLENNVKYRKDWKVVNRDEVEGGG